MLREWSRQGSLSVDRLGQIFSARELKTAFAAIAADHLLDGDVVVGLDLVPDGGGDRLTEVFQGLLLPRRIVPKLKRFLCGGDTNTTRVWSRQLACNHQFDGTVPFRLFSSSI